MFVINVILVLLVVVLVHAAKKKKPKKKFTDKNGKEVFVDFTHQEGPEEEENHYLKFHKCRDSGEVYGAAYLINKEHLLEQFTFYNLTWVNCEMGSFIMMNQVSLSLNFRGVIYGAITLYWWCLVLCGALDSSGILLSCPSIPLA